MTTEPTPSTDLTPPVDSLRTPWLVAAWPGLGGVASMAVAQLLQSLGAQPLGQIPEQDFFSIEHVEVQNGIARTGRLPRSLLFAWRDPQGRRDLIIFLGEAQPAANGYALCRRIVDLAIKHGTERVVTFAAMATAVHPAKHPRVFGATTAPELLASLRDHGIDPLQQGQIGGLNGALLAAAAERGIPGVCLLGEMPFFAAGAPNPKSALSALESFARLAEMEIDMKPLADRAQQMERQLIDLHDQLAAHQRALAEQGAPEGEEADAEAEPGPESAAEAPDREPEVPSARRRPRLDPAAERRIEELFTAAAEDRTRAVALKAELDRLGVFEDYEDRFLDLFRKAE